MEKILESGNLTVKADKDSFKIFRSGHDIFEMTWKEFFAINMSSRGDGICWVIFGSLYFPNPKEVTSTLYHWGRDNSEYVKKLRG